MCSTINKPYSEHSMLFGLLMRINETDKTAREKGFRYAISEKQKLLTKRCFKPGCQETD